MPSKCCPKVAAAADIRKRESKQLVSVFISVYLESGWRLLQISTVAVREQFSNSLLVFAIPAIACDSPAVTGRKFISVIIRS
jgi:hypothetical protein